ncbi:MAG: UDP-N-acetylglucosamine 2-epimerase (hydrolyzing) [Sphingobacteriales bacterium]|nr:MAG: UDP-N-acetylglucosamine 2-epimerase (hydrolyzing) [Sphingobacteriales bacterium]
MKVCVVTATRSEYGLLKPLIDKIQQSEGMQLLTLITGAHLSPEFGLTYKRIEEDGIKIDAKVDMLLSADTSNAIVKSMGLGMIGYADALTNLAPDLLVILGDRYEMLAVASAALIFGIPIVHIHGGEITEGAYDDAIRHAISKMSALHFASTEDYRQRIIQMGENPDNVYNVGAIGLDNIVDTKLLSRTELEAALGIKFKEYNYQVSFYPETLGEQTPEQQFAEVLDAISKQKDSLFIFSKSNADTDGRVINRMVEDFVNKHPDNAVCFTSLGSLRFLSLVKECNAIVGNSSSGILEAPSLHTATINIGDRQKGRIQAASVINVNAKSDEISQSFDLIRTAEFKKKIAEVVNPYGQGGTSQKIYNVLAKTDPRHLKLKHFYDLPQ